MIFCFLCRNAQWAGTLQYGTPYKGLGGQHIAEGKDSKVKRGVDDQPLGLPRSTATSPAGRRAERVAARQTILVQRVVTPLDAAQDKRQ